ncbi:MAG: hypothetical protein J5746_14840 [Victivallales bacterium]|nr:hypothetical protein [Victivallales bacterium]
MGVSTSDVAAWQQELASENANATGIDLQLEETMLKYLLQLEHLWTVFQFLGLAAFWKWAAPRQSF